MYIKLFEEFEYNALDNILNIATDEGLTVKRIPYKDGVAIFIYRFVLDGYGHIQHDVLTDTYQPIVDNDQFLQIVRDVHDRFVNEDIIDKREDNNNTLKHFLQISVNGDTGGVPIEYDLDSIDADINILHARFLIKN